ncbi:MAG: preprotein translocase subunit SecA [Pirellulales bacterium]|jgi:preprotein translocase subunit SecA|nr:preprotein translocase subunit SecA [Pirellulales bacterium]
METLERLWDAVTNAAAAFGVRIERLITGLFGSSNARYLRRIEPKIEAINALEPRYREMSEEELRAQTAEFRRRLAAGETLDDILVEAFAVCREGGRRFLGMRHYDVQLLGGMVLHSGNIAEMITGEGKTLVATLPAYLNALEGKGVHVVTVNDYLARRDMEWMGPLYMGLGLTVGAIQSGLDSAARQKAYACDITYGTNNEFGFDYLRDNMRMAARDDDRFPKHMQQSQGRLNFAIVDEVDNILIDEARTPLIISGPAHDDVTKYARADQIARQLKADVHFEVKEKEHSVSLTEDGVRTAEKLAGVESFYTAGNMEWPHLIDNSLKAHHLYKRDVNYVVQQGEVVIVDEFTGRLMPGRNWSDGLHQAVEAKEGVRIKEESQTLATVTLQNFFKLYNKLSGMTGTAMTEAGEFLKIYKLEVIAIPPNRGMQRINHPDVIYRTEREKWIAVADEVERINRWDTLSLTDGSWRAGTVITESDTEVTFEPRPSTDGNTSQKAFGRESIPREKIRQIERRGLPVLVGTVSIEKSERLASLLEKRGVKHQVLNAKQHKREADIVSQAGRLGAVTIATNMAGRGTDIILGGNPETMAWAKLQDTYPTRLDVPPEEWDALVDEISEREQMKPEGEKVRDMGGLQIIGTERHEARRIDLQLRGRCGRQGDPGSSRFFLCLEDDLMRIFAGEWVKNMLTRLGMQEGEAIESKMVTRRIEAAQRKVEERNFEIRKNLLEYDEVMDEQRKRVYGFRQAILEGADCRELILEMVDRQIDENISTFLAKDYGAETYAKWAAGQLSCELDGADYRGLSASEAERLAVDEAMRKSETQIFEAIEENLPAEEDESEWNWGALASFANARWKTSLRDRDLKKLGRDQVDEFLVEQAREAIQRIDLDEGGRFLDDDFGVRSACGWTEWRFGAVLNQDEVKSLEVNDFRDLVKKKAREIYADREIVYPVIVGLAHFSGRQPDGSRRLNREGLLSWARRRFDDSLSESDLATSDLEQLRTALRAASARRHAKDAAVREQAIAKLAEAMPTFRERAHIGPLGDLASSLATWLEQEANNPAAAEAARSATVETVERQVLSSIDDVVRGEMRRMERAVLLQILDNAWKDHLLAMDHLRSSVGLRGYAQVDPKVEYKREGMRTFDLMWKGIDDRVTDIVYRIEQVEDDALKSTWHETAAVHADASTASLPSPAASESDPSQPGASASGDTKAEPIRNAGQKVGRNDPCPCGSGKKFKNCCARSGGGTPVQAGQAG